MNNPQKNKFAMYQTTASACARFIAQGTPPAALAAQVALLQTKIAALAEPALGTPKTSKGQTSAKARAATELVTATYTVGQAVAAYASASGNAPLLASVAGSRSALARLRDADLPLRALTIHAAATANLAALADYALTAADLADLAQKIDAFKTLLTAPQDVKVENSALTGQVQAAFAEIDTLLEEKLDKLVEALARKAPAFVAEYHAARRIVDYAASHAGAGHTPPPPANPNPPPAQ